MSCHPVGNDGRRGEFYEYCKEYNKCISLKNLPTIRGLNKTNAQPIIKFPTILLKDGRQDMAVTAKDIPQLLGKISQVPVRRDLLEDIAEEERRGVLGGTCRGDPRISPLNNPASLLDITGPVEVHHITDARVLVAL